MQRTMLWTVAALILAFGLLAGCGGRPGEREFAKGLQQLERGQWVRAREQFEKSVRQRPGHEDNAQAYHYLGYIAWKLGDRDTAGIHFEQSRKENPTLFEPVFNLAILAYRQGDSGQAIALLNSAAQIRPSDSRPLEFLGHLYIEQENWRDARRALYEALARAPQSPRILTALSIVDRATGGDTAALKRLMQALERDPAYPPALYNLGQIYEQSPGQEENALATFQDFIDTETEVTAQTKHARRSLARLRGETPDPDEELQSEPEAARPPPPVPSKGPERRVTLDDLLKQAKIRAADGAPEQAVALCQRAAVQARQQGRVGDEERALRTAVEIAPREARAHYAWGRFLVSQKRNTEALTAFRRTVELDPQWVQAHLALANSARELKNYDVALTTLRTIADREPAHPDPLWALASLYQETGVTHLAVKNYEQFLNQFPSDPRVAEAEKQLALLRGSVPPPSVPAPVSTTSRLAAEQAFERGVSYQQDNEWDNAIFFYRRALENDPSMERARYNLGTVFIATRDWLAAEEVFAQAVEKAPDLIEPRYNWAWVLSKLGRDADAIAQLDTVLKQNPNYSQAHLLAGSILQEDRRTHAQAKDHYTRYLALQPQGSDAAAVRAWLDKNS